MPDAGPPAAPPATAAGVPVVTGRAIGRLLATGLLGLVVGVVGTSVHRAQPPWGLLLALLCVVSAGVLARAWTGWTGMLAAALGVFAAVSLLGGPGPGGDVLVALQPVGVVWYLGALAVLPVALLPRRWFSDDPRPPRAPGSRPERRRRAVSPAP